MCERNKMQEAFRQGRVGQAASQGVPSPGHHLAPRAGTRAWAGASGECLRRRPRNAEVQKPRHCARHTGPRGSVRRQELPRGCAGRTARCSGHNHRERASRDTRPFLLSREVSF